MIYAISLAYTLPTAADRHDLSIPELLQIGSMAGHKILRSLDRQLKPQQLKDCSEDKLRCLFLLVVGTILAIGYTDPSTCGTDAQNGSQFEGRQSFLCQLLAHYVVYLGSQLKHQIASHADQFILQAAPARWHKQGIFQWLSSPDETSELPLGLDLEQDTIFEGTNNFSHGLGDFRPSDSFKVILDHCYAAGDFWQDPVSLGGWPSQSFADAAFFHPVQAQGLNETEESFLAKPIDFILDPNFTSSCHCAPKQKRMIKLYRRPISIFDQVSPCRTTEPSPHLTQTAEGFLSCQADESTLHNLGNDNSTAYQQFGETPVDGYSLHHDSKQDTEVTPPRFSLSHVTLKERISMESVPNQSKLDPEQQLEVTRIRQRSACMTCSTPRQSRDLGGSRCRSCSRGLLAYEQQFLDFVPNQSLIPEWNISSSDVPQSQSSACQGFFPIDGPANHETRRLLV